MTQANPEPFPQAPNQQRKSSSGCWWAAGIGCLVVVVLVIVLGVVAYMGFQSLLDQATETEPAELPKVEMSDVDYPALQQRLDTFVASLKAGESPDPLTLTDTEINALLQHNPNWQPFGDYVYVTFTEGTVQGQVSWPIPFFEGRYFNGEAAFDVYVRNGALFVTVQSATFKGEPVPEEMVQQMKSENLAKELQNNPEFSKAVGNLGSIEVGDGNITLVPQGAASQT
jgi:hypothetical protein